MRPLFNRSLLMNPLIENFRIRTFTSSLLRLHKLSLKNPCKISFMAKGGVQKLRGHDFEVF